MSMNVYIFHSISGPITNRHQLGFYCHFIMQSHRMSPLFYVILSENTCYEYVMNNYDNIDSYDSSAKNLHNSFNLFFLNLQNLSITMLIQRVNIPDNFSDENVPFLLIVNTSTHYHNIILSKNNNHRKTRMTTSIISEAFEKKNRKSKKRKIIQ